MALRELAERLAASCHQLHAARCLADPAPRRPRACCQQRSAAVCQADELQAKHIVVPLHLCLQIQAARCCRDGCATQVGVRAAPLRGASAGGAARLQLPAQNHHWCGVGWPPVRLDSKLASAAAYCREREHGSGGASAVRQAKAAPLGRPVAETSRRPRGALEHHKHAVRLSRQLATRCGAGQARRCARAGLPESLGLGTDERYIWVEDREWMSRLTRRRRPTPFFSCRPQRVCWRWAPAPQRVIKLKRDAECSFGIVLIAGDAINTFTRPTQPPPATQAVHCLHARSRRTPGVLLTATAGGGKRRHTNGQCQAAASLYHRAPQRYTLAAAPATAAGCGSAASCSSLRQLTPPWHALQC